MSDRFDSFVQTVADHCCHAYGAMPIAQFSRIIAIVGKHGPPRRLRESLERLGYTIDDDHVIGLTPKTAEFYVRTAFGTSVDIADVLATIPSRLERKYAASLLSMLPADGEMLIHYSLI